MKRPFITILVCSVLLLSFIACEQESLSLSVEAKEISLSPEELLQSTVTQDIIFQFSTVDLETGIENGWVIDREGSIKTYYFENKYIVPHSSNETWTEQDVEALYHQTGEVLSEVDPADLLNKFNLIQQVEPGRLSDLEVLPNSSRNTAFYAFSRLQNNESSDPACSEGSYDSSQSPAQFDRLVLQISGRSNRVNQSYRAGEIVTWLSNLNQDLH
jgi:hypothetical protein